jgi:hypothetical protein
VGNIIHKVIVGSTYTFDNLAPNIHYTVRVQVDGNEGIVEGETGENGV